MDIADLDAEHIPAAGQLLARAFINDGLTRHMYPDVAEREMHTPWHFAAVVRYAKLFGRVHAIAGDELMGVAVWLPPGQCEMTENRIAASGLDACPAVLGEAAFGRFVSALQSIEPFHGEDVPGRHWYLSVIGVHPEHSGKGIGSALLKPTLAEADADGLPCYLETAESRNLPFYERHGFDVLRHGAVPGTDFEYWTMLRQPR